MGCGLLGDGRARLAALEAMHAPAPPQQYCALAATVLSACADVLLGWPHGMPACMCLHELPMDPVSGLLHAQGPGLSQVWGMSRGPPRLDALEDVARDPPGSAVCPAQPMEIYVDDEAKLTLHGLVQHYIMLNEEEKNRKLNDLLDALDFNQACLLIKPHLPLLCYVGDLPVNIVELQHRCRWSSS